MVSALIQLWHPYFDSNKYTNWLLQKEIKFRKFWYQITLYCTHGNPGFMLILPFRQNFRQFNIFFAIGNNY